MSPFFAFYFALTHLSLIQKVTFFFISSVIGENTPLESLTCISVTYVLNFPLASLTKSYAKRPTFKKADIDVGVALNACRHLISHAAGVLYYMTVMLRYWPSEHLIIGF